MKRAQNGYTMVELITVMIVVGILAAVAIPRITNTGEFSANAYRNEVTSALRHAQKSAVSHRRTVCADISDQSIVLTIAVPVADNNCAQAFASPTGPDYASRDNVKAAGAFIGKRLLFLPNGEIRLNDAGTPIASGVIQIDGQADIRIDGNTGHVQ